MLRSVPRVIVDTAAAVARLSNHKYRFGAVVYRKHQVLGVGHNVVNLYSAYNTNTKWKNNLHAEHMAIIRANLYGPNQARKVSVYVHRLNNSGNGALLARPCCNCMALLADAGVLDVYYSDSEGSIAYERISKSV